MAAAFRVLAAEIDADAAAERNEFLGQMDRDALRHYDEVQSERAKAVADLRRRIEEAVDKRFYTVGPGWQADGIYDVIDKGVLLAALADFFGENS